MLLPALLRPDRATVHPVLPLDSATTVARSWGGASCSSGLWRTGPWAALPLPSCTMRCPCRATPAAPAAGALLLCLGINWALERLLRLVHAPWLCSEGLERAVRSLVHRCQPRNHTCTSTLIARATPTCCSSDSYQLADPHVNHHGAEKSVIY
jgi:hypothetical protein